MSKQNSSTKTAKTTKNNGNPYQPDSMYAAIFAALSKQPLTKEERKKALAAVAKKTKKSVKCVGWGFSVLRLKGHQSNNGKSSIKEGKDGKSMLVALK